MNLKFTLNDGGRRDAGFKGHTGDCVTRAVCIATGAPYRQTYNALGELYAEMSGGLKRTARGGVATPVSFRYLTDRGWKLRLTPNAYFTAEAIPMQGTIIAVLHRHDVAVIDGVVMDSWDSRKSNRTKCGAPKLMGYYYQSEEAKRAEWEYQMRLGEANNDHATGGTP